MLEIKKENTKPDNIITLEINGAKITIHEFFGNENINEIISNHIKREFDPDIPNDENV